MSDVDDDGDMVGMDDGMEPESATGAAPGGDDSDDEAAGDGDMEVMPGGAVSRVATPRGTRPVSAKVRDMLKDIAAKHKASGDAGDDGEDVAITDGIEEAYGKPKSPNGAPAGAAGALPPPGAAAASPPAGVPAVALPPAASLDPEVGKLREQWGAKLTELDAREKSIAERESASDIDGYRDLYTEKGAPAVVRFVKMLTGLDGDALKEELADLVTDLSSAELGVDVPGEVRQRLDTKRAQRSIKAMKDSLSQREVTEKAKREQAEEANRRSYAINLLKEEIKKPDHSKLYPHLAAEDDPGLLIVEVYERRIKEGRDAKAYLWTDAAKEVNDYLTSQASAWFDKRKHLFTAATGNSGQGQAQQQATRETTQGQRRSPPPQQQAQTPPVVPTVRNGKYDPEAHRRQTKQNPKIRAMFAERQRDSE